MCMIENADGSVEVIQKERKRKARKPHQCRECWRDIEAGEQYEHMVYKWDGNLTAYKICLHCRVAMSWLEKECHGYVYGQIETDILEHVEEGNYSMALTRLAVGMKWKWTKRNGERMPIPACPPTSWDSVKALPPCL